MRAACLTSFSLGLFAKVGTASTSDVCDNEGVRKCCTWIEDEEEEERGGRK
jgi:hypothetical protein